jgi:transcription elongation factor Elf1
LSGADAKADAGGRAVDTKSAGGKSAGDKVDGGKADGGRAVDGKAAGGIAVGDKAVDGKDFENAKRAAFVAAAPLRVFRARRLAEGLENILYICPGCGSEFSMTTAGNEISCGNCELSAALRADGKLIHPIENYATQSDSRHSPGGVETSRDDFRPSAGDLRSSTSDMLSSYGAASSGKILPGSIHDWFKLQVAYEMRRLDEASRLSKPAGTRVIVRMPAAGGGGLAECGEGELRVDRDGWHFEGMISAGNIRAADAGQAAGDTQSAASPGQPGSWYTLDDYVRLHFPIETVPAFPFDPDDNFQIYSKGNFYAFTPRDNRAACVKFAVIGECAYWRYSQDIQMTEGVERGYAVNTY